MKILYITNGAGVDYQADVLFHGLRSKFGETVVDVAKMPHMYKGCKMEGLYGKGFTICGNLEDIPVDREDISAKIKANYFDFVIFGSIWRCRDYLDTVMESVPREKVIFIDGEDGPEYLKWCIGFGHYFKRELHSARPGVWPIQFAIPQEKIGTYFVKTELMAPLDPLDTRTYIYQDEVSYYASYAAAMFGKTMKKAGYDCMRHYEIMANGCLPYFLNLEHCPETIMVNLPKQELMVAKSVLEYKGFNFFETSAGHDLWQRLMEKVNYALQTRLTTVALAQYVIDMVNSYGKAIQKPDTVSA